MLPRKSYELLNAYGQIRLNELQRLLRDAARTDLLSIRAPYSQSPAGTLIAASRGGSNGCGGTSQSSYFSP